MDALTTSSAVIRATQYLPLGVSASRVGLEKPRSPITIETADQGGDPERSHSTTLSVPLE